MTIKITDIDIIEYLKSTSLNKGEDQSFKDHFDMELCSMSGGVYEVSDGGALNFLGKIGYKLYVDYYSSGDGNQVEKSCKWYYCYKTEFEYEQKFYQQKI